MATTNVALIRIVLIEQMPDGSKATEDQVAAAILLARDVDVELCELLCVGKHGRRPDGSHVGWDDRQQALERLASMTDGPHETTMTDEAIDMAEEMLVTADAGDREARRELAVHRLGSSRALRGDRVRRGNARARLEQAAQELGYEPNELLLPIPKGHLVEAERIRRDDLARAIHRARVAGAKLGAIGEAVGIPKQRVSDLAARGRELEDETEPAPVS